MKEKKKKKKKGVDPRQPLREMAEEKLSARSGPKKFINTEDLQRLVHELEIHQIELKLQNEELRSAQVELASSRDRYTDLYDFAPLAYITLNKDGIILDSNLMAAEVLGVERRELVRANLTKFVLTESQDDWYLHRQAALSSEARQVCEIRIRRTDGTLLSMRAESIGIGEGKEWRCRTVLVDITERKRAEEEREQLLLREQAVRRELEAATKAKDRFLAMASHELRTPLTPILGWIGILRSKMTKDVNLEHALECIERNAKIQAKLVDDLLDVSGSLTGKMRLKFKDVVLHEIINAAVETVRPTADAKQIKIQTELEKDAGLVSGDSERLQQVIWNLLTNAVKFTPSGGQVGVQLLRNASSAQIIVSDTGEGIRADFLAYVFDPFSQADHTMKSERGLGLGLAIAHQIVQMHGGTIRVSSTEGEGSRFTVEIPIRNDRGSQNQSAQGDDRGAHPAATGHLATGPEFQGLHMLVVDDEPDTLTMLKTVLGGTHAEVRVCGTAAEALKMLQKWRTDALISDLDMPGQDGYELIGKIRKLEPRYGHRVVAIALTAHVLPKDRSRALRDGFDAFVAKPVMPSELLAAVSGGLQKTA